VLAKVGCSGDASGPHLHFHVSASPSPCRGEGLPYVIDAYEVLGWERQDLEPGDELPALS